MNGFPDVDQHYSGEVFRKAIHLSSIAIPVTYAFVSKTTLLTLLIPVTVLFVGTDIARLLSPSFRLFYHDHFGWLLRAHEKHEVEKRLNGATYVLLSATIGIMIFPKVIIITAFAILIVSDTIAALVGRKFGRHRFLKKSFEGTLAFFLSAVCVVCLSPKIAYLPGEYAIGIVAALIGAVVEALSIAVDDNISIPFSIGAAMWLMYAVFLPSLNIFALDTSG